MNRWPLAMVPFISTINDILKTTREEIKLYGYDLALEMHCQRSNLWIMQHQMNEPASEEEGVAIVCFAAALQFVNLLFATREVLNDTKLP